MPGNTRGHESDQGRVVYSEDDVTDSLYGSDEDFESVEPTNEQLRSVDDLLRNKRYLSLSEDDVYRESEPTAEDLACLCDEGPEYFEEIGDIFCGGSQLDRMAEEFPELGRDDSHGTERFYHRRGDEGTYMDHQ